MTGRGLMSVISSVWNVHSIVQVLGLRCIDRVCGVLGFGMMTGCFSYFMRRISSLPMINSCMLF